MPPAMAEDKIGGEGARLEDTAMLVRRLKKEKIDLQNRLEFVEELLGPTETQRKLMQEQLVAARAAAVRAKYRGAAVPVKVAGRLDEHILLASGITERDAGLLQGGCLPDKDGVMQDVSMLGDPKFQPYNLETGEPLWNARGGMLQLSMGEVRSRFGATIALDVARCAQELDKYDASRRVGIELPWHPLENRELQPAEVITLLERELTMQNSILCANGAAASHFRLAGAGRTPGLPPDHGAGSDYTTAPSRSPYLAVSVPPRLLAPRRKRRSRPQESRTSGSPPGGGGVGGVATGSSVVPLPRVEPPRRGAPAPPEAALLGGAGRRGERCAQGLQRRMQEPLEQPMPSCRDCFF